MPSLNPKFDRLRKLNYEQRTQLATVLLNAISEHPNPIDVIEHLLVAFPHDRGSIEPTSTDPTCELLSDNEWKFNVDRVLGRVEQVETLLRTRNPSLRHAAEIIWGALCSFRTNTEKTVAFALMLNNPGITPYVPIPENVVQAVEPEYQRREATERLLGKINLLTRLFHDPNLSRPMAVRAALQLLTETSDPAERYVMLDQIIWIGSHIDCLRRSLPDFSIPTSMPAGFASMVEDLVKMLRKKLETEDGD